MRQKAKVENYDAPAGGWGSLNALAHILTQEEVAILGSEILLKQNKPDGIHVRQLLLGQAGQAASVRVLREWRQGDRLGEVTRKTVTPEFFAQHTPTELRTAALAKATLKPNPKLDWDTWTADYSRVPDAIERTYPDQFKDFNTRMFEPGGFPRPLAARERKWKTPSGKANFTVPKSAFAPPRESDGVYELMTMRADGRSTPRSIRKTIAFAASRAAAMSCS
ncbi:hypothetical protein [Bradyrhizobium sp. LMG 9283]|uniref:hypothetical protein n=1 Tax=Bradyrhizobium sp. LMG 9283 TaxID=592064 RepID=UPI0038903336